MLTLEDKLKIEDLFEYELNNKKLFKKDNSIKLLFCKDNSLENIYLESNYLIDNKYANLEKLGECLFANLTKLKEVQLPYTIKEIERRAFSNCINLQRINLDNDLKVIGDYAFLNCKNLNIDSIYSEKIGKYAFSKCNNIEKIMICTQNIDDYAFSSCDNLKEININDNNHLYSCPLLKTNNIFSNYAFAYSKSLNKIIYNNNVNEINPTECVYLFDSTFKECINLENIFLRGNLNISKAVSSFEGCSKLKEVNLYTNDKSIIPHKMFESCVSLENVNGLEQYEIIDSYAFKNCHNLTKVYLSNAKHIEMYAFINNNLNEINLPNVITINSYAFKNNMNLSKISLGKNVQSINLYAFENCINIKEIEILSENVKFEPLSFENVFPEILTISSLNALNAFRTKLMNLKVLYINKVTEEIENVILDLMLTKTKSDKLGFIKYIK